MENRFAGLHHRSKGLALLVFDALLVDGEVHDGCEVGDNFAGILQADRDVVGAGNIGQVFYERNCVFLGETEAVIVVLQAWSIMGAKMGHIIRHT